MYSRNEVERALAVLRRSGSYKAAARETGISRAAIRSWATGGGLHRRWERRAGTCPRCAGYRFPTPQATEFAYAYLLGLYLGDGHLAKHPRGVYRLRVHLDRAYPVIVQECEAAIAILAPANRVATVQSSRYRMDIPGAFSRHWPCLFPQHGPGRKHQRRIVLEGWQREILDRYPGRFLRGLIHSDGYRGINTIRHPKKTYRYPRYQFSNRSDDIRVLFCEYCDKLGADWRRMNRWTISVARRDSVALLDRHIGPKR
jgi:hypothetical protein